MWYLLLFLRLRGCAGRNDDLLSIRQCADKIYYILDGELRTGTEEPQEEVSHED